QRVAQLLRSDAGAALEFEQIFAVGPALALFADTVGDWHAHVVEEHLVDLVIAADGQDRPRRDAGALHVDQDEGDAVLLPLALVGADQREHHVGVVGVRGPDLGAVDDVVVTVAHRAGFQRRQIGAGARFGIALAPVVLAGENPRQKIVLLLRRAEPDDDGTDHLDAHDVYIGNAGACGFGLEDPAFRRCPVRSAMVYRPARRAPAFFVQGALPGHADVRV